VNATTNTNTLTVIMIPAVVCVLLVLSSIDSEKVIIE